MTEWFARNILFMPEGASKEGPAIDALIVYVHYLMIALFAGWTLYFFYVLWRFNARRSPKADYEGSRSHLPKYTEIAVVVAEMVLLFVVAYPIWGKNVEQFPDPKESTVIAVMAQQFAWNGLYAGPDGKFGRQDMKLISDQNLFGLDPDDPETKDDFPVLNEIHVEVNKPVLIYLSSKDVIHSLKILAMRFTQDAIPGLRIPCTFTPTKVGRYQIECAQLCGNGHASMAGGFVVVQSPEDFKKWYDSKMAATKPVSFE